ncbi:MAG: hypothetical protein EOP04_06885, partial [Proteobacteria bacterium]
MTNRFNIFICLSLATLLGLFSCRSFDEKVDPLIKECGVVPVGDAGVYIKLVNNNNKSFASSDLEQMRINIIDADGHKKNFVASSGGCVGPYDGTGLLNAYSPGKDLFISKKINPRFKNELIRVALEPRTRSSFSLDCPSGTLFSNRFLKNPISSSKWFLNDPRDLELEVRNTVSPFQTYRLVSTRFNSIQEYIEDLDTSDIPEGVYVVEGFVKDVFESSESKQVFAGACNLVVLKGAQPPLKSVDLDVTVLKVGERLPFVTKGKYDELRVCKEPLSSETFYTSPNQCDQMKSCQDDEMYSLTDTSASELGLFLYSTYVVDRAGNSSEKTCKTIAVVETPVPFKLSWVQGSFNRPHSFMNSPEGMLSARVDVDPNHILSNSYVESHLYCKVEIISRNVEILKGNEILCTSGACLGKTLAEFIPCSTTIDFSLDSMWSKASFRNSQIKLTVKTGGETGYPFIQDISLGVNANRWVNQSAGFDEDFELSGLNNMAILDNHGLLVPDKNFGVRYYDGKTWSLLQNPSGIEGGTVKSIQILQATDASKNAFGVWTVSDTSGIQSQKVYKWQERSWVITSIQLPSTCDLLSIFSADTLLCVRPLSLIISDPTRVVERLLPSQFDPTKDKVEILSGRAIFLAQSDHILYQDLQLDDSGWKEVSGLKYSKDFEIYQIVSQQDSIWVASYNTLEGKIGRIDSINEKWVYSEFEFPSNFDKNLLSERSITRTSDQKIYLNGFEWIPENSSWK